MSYRRLSGVQSAPRVMRGAPVFRPAVFDVPLFQRDLGADIEMPAVCARAGEVMYSNGTCGPASLPPTVRHPVTSPKVRFQLPGAAAASAASTVAGMSRTTIALAALGAAGLIYYLSKHK